MTPTHTRRSGKLYRYYVSTAVLKQGRDACTIGRVPAGEIERAVIDQMRTILRSPEIVARTSRPAKAIAPGIDKAEVRDALHRLDPLWEELFPAEQARIVQLLVERVDVGEGDLAIRLRTAGLTLSPDERTVTVRVPLAFRKRGGRKRVVAPNGTEARAPSPRAQVSTLIKALARAHRWQRMLEGAEYGTIAELAAVERINPSYLARVCRLTLLAPATVESLLLSRQKALTLGDLMKPFPVVWSDQGF